MTTKPTADDAVSVSPATGEVLRHLEDAAAYFRAVGMHGMKQQIEAAIDRLIVLDGAKETSPKVPGVVAAMPSVVVTAPMLREALEVVAPDGSADQDEDELVLVFGDEVEVPA